MFDPQKKNPGGLELEILNLIEIHRKKQTLSKRCVKKGYCVMGFVFHKTSYQVESCKKNIKKLLESLDLFGRHQRRER